MKNKKIVKKTVGFILIAMGLGVLLSSIGLNIRQNYEKEKAIEEFKELIVSGDNSSDGNSAVEGDVIAIVRIPSIDSENPVRESVTKNVLADSLGHDMTTTLPGEKGNCVIAGHRNYTFGKFFNRLDEVAVNDLIYVDTATQTYTYMVTEIKVVDPDDLSVLESTDNEQITLYTCTPIYIATHRLVVIAERIQ